MQLQRHLSSSGQAKDRHSNGQDGVYFHKIAREPWLLTNHFPITNSFSSSPPSHPILMSQVASNSQTTTCNLARETMWHGQGGSIICDFSRIGRELVKARKWAFCEIGIFANMLVFSFPSLSMSQDTEIAASWNSLLLCLHFLCFQKVLWYKLTRSSSAPCAPKRASFSSLSLF